MITAIKFRQITIISWRQRLTTLITSSSKQHHRFSDRKETPLHYFKGLETELDGQDSQACVLMADRNLYLLGSPNLSIVEVQLHILECKFYAWNS